MVLPEKCRRRLRTCNRVESLIEEIRRREKIIRFFPNQSSSERLIGALLIESHERWISGRVYFKIDEYWERKEIQQEGQKN